MQPHWKESNVLPTYHIGLLRNDVVILCFTVYFCRFVLKRVEWMGFDPTTSTHKLDIITIMPSNIDVLY